MRLLNTEHLSLHEFSSNEIPEYAIFSHTWGRPEDEVLFVDFDRGTAAQKPGFTKVSYACTQAKQDEFSWIWIDTCCIDKASSAELSEAINSMYKWYAGATNCYAYLADVDDSSYTQLAASRWFTRGWTLQELIAPSSVIFFTRNWERVGTKAERYNELARITGIDVDTLRGQRSLDSTSIAKRMSWASKRETGRPEDAAYCLMGLFNVNMPMLYGEGEKAFIRLQEEIMKYSDDQSIFAWKDGRAQHDSYHGLLAKHPGNFAESGNFVPYRDWEPRTPFSMSNRGLRIDLHLSPLGRDVYIAALDCPASLRYEGFLGIYLKRISAGDHQYARVRPTEFCQIASRGIIETVYVRQNVKPPDTHDIYPVHAIQLREGPSPEDGCRLNTSFDWSRKTVAPVEPARARAWVSQQCHYAFELAKGTVQLSAVLVFTCNDATVIFLMLGSTMDSSVGYTVLALPQGESLPNRDQLQGLYRDLSRPPGNGSEIIAHHRVRVKAEPQVYGGIKYYMVDIAIEPVMETPAGIMKIIHGNTPLIEKIDEKVSTIANRERRASMFRKLLK